MLNALIRLSLRYRTLVLALCVVVLVYGGYLLTTLPIDVFPDLDRPRVVILTECPGLSPEDIETLVTLPIETAILGASGVEAVRSQSSQGMVVIYVEFSWRTEIRYARQVVSERLATVSMPAGIRPLMTPPASIMGQILHVGLHRQAWPTRRRVGRGGANRPDGRADDDERQADARRLATERPRSPGKLGASFGDGCNLGSPSGRPLGFVRLQRPDAHGHVSHFVGGPHGVADNCRLGPAPATAQASRHRGSDHHGRRSQAVSGAWSIPTNCWNTTSRCKRSKRRSRRTT